jgi:ClpA/ClpB-like protein
MPYKGGDLHLRLGEPREAPALAPRPHDAIWQLRAAGAAAPIAVDEAVLACCNAAYDAAVFHGASEVRLEHLLHALTRISGAGQALADLGIRADVLRRDTAMVIAAEPPTSAGGAGSAPRTSAALGDALKRAADLAAQRAESTSIHDLLRALLGGGPDSPAAALLMRAAADPQRLERWRDAPRREALLSEPEGHATRASAASPLAERLDRLEASLQALREEAAADRRLAADLVRAVQAELQAFRSQGAPAHVAGSGEAIEAVLEAKLGKFGEAMAALAARLGSIDRLAAGGSNWEALEARLAAVESSIAAQTSALTERVSSLLASSPKLTEAPEQGSQPQLALEQALQTSLQASEEAGRATDRRHGEIRQAMGSLDASQQRLAGNLDTWRVESAADIAIVSNRLQQLEQKVLDALDRLGEDVHAVRLGHLENGARRGNGFKRWLYGTGTVFASGWRSDALGHILSRPRIGGKS